MESSKTDEEFILEAIGLIDEVVHHTGLPEPEDDEEFGNGA